MATASNITLRAEKGEYISYEEMDLNLLELRNLIDEYNAFLEQSYTPLSSEFNNLSSAYDQFVIDTEQEFQSINSSISGLDNQQTQHDTRISELETGIQSLAIRGGLKNRGTWVAGTYDLGDVVKYTNGLSYISASDNNAQEPQLNQSSSFWIRFTSSSIALQTAFDGTASGINETSVQAAIDSLADRSISQFKRPEYVLKSSNFAALSSGWYSLDASSSFSITLPATPTTGDLIEFFIVSGDPSINNITILRNGNTIEGQASDYIITTIRPRLFKMFYNGSTWVTDHE